MTKRSHVKRLNRPERATRPYPAAGVRHGGEPLRPRSFIGAGCALLLPCSGIGLQPGDGNLVAVDDAWQAEQPGGCDDPAGHPGRQSRVSATRAGARSTATTWTSGTSRDRTAPAFPTGRRTAWRPGRARARSTGPVPTTSSARTTRRT